MANRDFLIGLGAALAGLALWLVIIPWQVKTAAAQVDEISPALFPRLLAFLLIGLGVAYALNHRPRRGVAAGDGAAGKRAGWRAYARAGGFTLLGATYLQLMSQVGYRVATALALAAFVLYLGRGDRLWRAALVGLIGALVIAELFWRGFRIPLPRGFLFELTQRDRGRFPRRLRPIRAMAGPARHGCWDGARHAGRRDPRSSAPHSSSRSRSRLLSPWPPCLR